MWMWSEPFFVKLNDGSECAVLLMDTQGTYDEFTTQLEWSRIVGLSLLTSSCLIFNFFKTLQEDTLSSLEAFMDYGLMAAGENEGNGTSHPFQKLIFLIRDWNTPAEYPYGAKGGQTFLQKKLEVKDDQPDEAKRIRNSIKSCFDQLHCFLMPDPGEKMKMKDYDGSIQGLAPKFAKNLETFVTDLLDPENLNVKMVGETPIKASGLGLFFENYIRVFNSGTMIEPLSLYEATSQITNLNLVLASLETYRKSMQNLLRKQVFFSDKDISKHHSKSVENAVQQFDNARKSSIGNESSIKEYKDKLVEDLDKEYKEYKIKNLEKKLKIIQQSSQSALNKYREEIELEMGEGFVSDLEFSSISTTCKSDALSRFNEECSCEDQQVLNADMKKLEETLNHEEENFCTINNKRKLDAEKSIKELIGQSIETYLANISQEIGKSPYVSPETLDALNMRARDEALNFYSKGEKKAASPKCAQEFEDELKGKLESSFNKIKTENENKKLELELSAAALVNEKVKRYEDQIGIILENVKSEEELKEEHDCCVRDIFASFEQSDGIPTEIIQSQLPQLKSILEKSFCAAKQEFALNSKCMEADYDKIRIDTLGHFNLQMDEFIKSKEFHEEDDLVDEISTRMQEAIDGITNQLRNIGINDSDLENQTKLLKDGLETSAEKNKEQNIFQQEHAQLKVQNDVTDSVSEYQTCMKNSIDNCRNEGELKSLHNKTKADSIQGLKSKYSGVPPSFIAKYLGDLEAEIDQNFRELEEVFLLKKAESEAGTKSALSDAHKYYVEEMEKEFGNEDFMRPTDLDKIHKNVTQRALDRCTKKTPLNEIQKGGLIEGMEKVYRKYQERNHANMPTNPAIGIDLGTTFCCVGVYRKGKVTIIENYGKKTTPSYVAFNDSGEHVGEAAKNQAHENPDKTIYDAKRIIGRPFDDEKLQADMKLWPFKVVQENGNPKVEVAGKTYFPEQISGKLLKEMKRAAEDYLGCEIKNAVITVPAYFNDGQRQATIHAGTLAGLNVLTILNEPTAAAVAYQLQHKSMETRNVLIFDLGGGTFDIAVLVMKDGNIEVKASDGDTHLGGEDFDNNLVNHCALEFQKMHGIDLMSGKSSSIAQERQDAWRRIRRLKSACEDQKVNLSTSRKVNITVDAIYGSKDLNVTVTRDTFENLNDALFQKTIQIVDRALETSGISKSQINDIVLVGGSTRIPKVQQLLSNYFGGKALDKKINPDESVAYGAAIQAAILNGEIAKDSVDFTKIRDVIPMSLGVEVYGGDFSTIIPKNTQIPVRLHETYKTAHNNQTSVQIVVYQGEDGRAINNDKLGEFYLNGIPPGLAEAENIQVYLEITEQGILHVKAECCSTGGSKDLPITEYKNRLSKAAIQKLLAEG